MAEGRSAEAFAALSESAPGGQVSNEAALLRSWAAAGAGKWNEATALPDIKDRLYRLIAILDQALLMEREKRYGDAETAFKAALSEKAGRPLIIPAYGVFLERRGRQKDAVALYDEALAESPGDPAVLSARQRASSGGKAPPMLSIREGAAQALMAPAGSLMAEKAPQSALIYFRMILRLDPAREDSLMMVADIEADAGDKAAAREIYARIPKSSDRYLTARARLAFTYQDSDKAQALAIARETAAGAPDSEDAQLVLADILRVNERYDESNKILDAMIAKDGARASWRLYYMRGAGEDRANNWTAAEADLQKALAMHPDDAELLNYLGYAWISRGEHVQEAMKMIQKAVDQEPDNGAYVDSLGWAYFKIGDYRNAVEKLERATELEAGDAEINDHLGDAYWKVGRKDEARFKWRAVLSLQPDPEVKTRAEAKLNSPQGVDAVGPSRAIARQ
jgi:tetratricopeptide (TPR) repeat protein